LQERHKVLVLTIIQLAESIDAVHSSNHFLNIYFQYNP